MRKIAFFLLSLFAAAAAVAEQSVDQRKGFNAENVYFSHDIDTVNAFNGNLTISIPIGPRYPIAEGLSYGLVLHSNANLWENEVVWDQDGDFSPHSGSVSSQAVGECNREDGVTVARPHMAANAGLGWTLTLGRLSGPSDPASRVSHGWTYESPDGAEHQFYETLHNDPATESAVPDDVMYTQDRSFLRMKFDPATNTRIIEFPDGSVHTFAPPSCGVGWWMPVRITNAHAANFLDISYVANDVAGLVDWVLQDNHGRRHVVRFKPTNWDKGPHLVVDTVTLETFGGVEAVYKFHYTEKLVARPDWSENCFGYSQQAPVAVLDRIDLPVDPSVPSEEPTSYSFVYEQSSFEAGLPGEATLPTGGRIRWTWGEYQKPVEHHTDVPFLAGSWGVVKRELFMPNAAAAHAAWEYVPILSPHEQELPHEDPRMREMRNLVTDPLGNRTASYFSVSVFDHEFWKADDYGKPFTRRYTDGDGRSLSEVVYPPGVTIVDTEPLKNAIRATYVRYVYEPRAEGRSGELQWRLESTRVIHYQGGTATPVVVSDVISDHTDYDGLGNFRTTTVRKPSGGDAKTTTTAFNPDRLSRTAAFPVNRPWVTGTFSYTETTFGTESSRTDFCFDTNTGFLQRKRVRRNGDPSRDLLVEWRDTDNDGGADFEEYWGGDDHPLAGSFSTCNVAQRPTSLRRYSLTHEWEFGVRSSTQHSGVAFKSLDLTIDRSGLPSASRDTAGVETAFDYNPRSQLRTVAAEDDAVTEYTYVVTPDSHPAASVTAQQKKDGQTLTDVRYYYDGFGRLVQQRQRMPLADGQWSVTGSSYDKLGRPEKRFVARPASGGGYAGIPADTPATITAYEPLGRPATLTQPDGRMTTFTYTGTSETRRTVSIETGESQEEPVSTQESYDIHGRLVAVREGLTLQDQAGELTSYQYDEGDRLARIEAGIQSRIFDYDGAGLLVSEQHPESGTTEYEYDARGHMVSRLDAKQIETRYEYDSAERLKTVTDATHDLPLKSFTYDAGVRGLGKTSTATRHNHHSDFQEPVLVTETFSYAGKGGRLSSKKTDVTGPAGFEGASFTDGYEYDALGAVEMVTYPACAGCGASGAPDREVTTSFENGYVTAVAPYTVSRGILYNANGLPRSIQRRNADGSAGALWEQHVAAHGMSRPDRTSVSNFCSGFRIDDGALPAEKSVTYDAAADITVPVTGATSYAWYEGEGTTPISGQTTSHLTVPVRATTKFWMRAMNGTCTVDSRVFTVTIAGCEPVPPVIAAPAEIRPGQVASASIPDGAATYEWTITNGAFTTPNPAGNSVSFTSSSCSGTVTLTVKTNCHANAVSRSVAIAAPAVAVVNEPKSILRGESTTIRARLTGTTPWTATWSDGQTITDVATEELTRTVSPQETTEYTITAAASHGCSAALTGSVLVTVNVCAPILTQPVDKIVQSGGTARFTVVATADSTFKWYEGIRGDTSRPLPGQTGNVLEITNVSHTSYYWCRVTSSLPGCVEDTNTVAANVCTNASIAAPQHDYTGDPYRIAPGESLALDVLANGSFVAYEWRVAEVTAGTGGSWSGNPPAAIAGTTPRFTWTATAADIGKTLGFYAGVEGACSGGVAAERLVKVVQVVAANASCPTPVIISYPASEIAVGQNGPGLLYVSVLPYPDGPGLEDPANLQYLWFVDGNPLLRADGSLFTNHQYTPPVETTQTVTVEVSRPCGSPSARLSMFLYNDVVCPLPPLSVNRQAITENDPAGSRTFRAQSPWPSVTFTWYRGDSGDTREPYAEGADLTLPTGDVGTYWVRATSPCGTTADSPTVTSSVAGCSPIQITVQPQSAEIKADTARDLTFEAFGSPEPTYFAWFTSDSPSPVFHSKIYPVRPLKTTTYWAQVASPGCHSATTMPAKLLVTSCDDIQVVQAPQTASIDEGDTASLTVNATTTGSTLAYQWFEGERGNESQPVTQKTSTPDFHPQPAKTTRYWVRVSRAGGCEIDLAAVTVYVCRTPVIAPHPTVYESRTPAYTHRLVALAEGDNLQYRWYIGAVGDVSAPVSSEPVYVTSPNQTTQYWFRVTSDCYGTTPDRYADSQQILISVCPSITAQPVAQKPEVMPGTTTTLTIAAARGDQIRWYRGNAGDTTNFVQSGESITTPPITADTTFWALVTSGGCSVESQAVTVRVCTSPAVQWHTSVRTQVAVSESQTLYVSPTTATWLTYTWYEGPASNVAASQLLSGPGSTNISHTTAPLVQKTFWVRVQEPSGCYADTPALTIDPCIPTITAEPQPVMIDSGATTPLTVTANGGPLTYQWFRGATGDTTSPVDGATAASLAISPAADTSYWVRVTGCGHSKDSAAALVSVCRIPAITGQPQNVTTNANVNTTLSVTATGTELAYQWYIGTSGVTTSPVASATSSTYVVSPSTTTNYWVKVSGRCGTPVNSSTAKVSVAPTITTQPAGSWVMSGTSRTLTVAATGTELRYAWMVNGVEISGATSTSYTTPPIAATTSYTVRVWSGNAYRDSAVATLSVCTRPIVSWHSSVRTSVAQSEPQTLSLNVTPSGNYNVSYTWYQGNSGDVAGSTLLSGPGATNISHSISPTATTKYWVRVSETSGCYADTPTLTVSVCVPTITAQPPATVMLDKVSNPSASITLSVAANGGALTYQWYIGQPGDTTQPISGATSSSYTASPNADTTYWARVTGSCGVSKDSTAALVVMCRATAITSQPPSVTANANVNTTLSVGATGTDLTYQWYVGASGVTTSPVPSATSSTYVVSPSTTTDYWVKVSGRCGAASNSNTVKVSIAPTIATQPAGSWVMSGTSRTLTVAATGTQLRYAWMLNGTEISGATNTSYTTPAITATTSYSVRVWSGNAYRDSTTATLSLCTRPTVSWHSSVKTSVAQGEPQTLYLNVTPSGNYNVSYTWYQGNSGDVAGSTLLSGPGATNISHSISLTSTTKYWVRVSETSGCYADTPTLTVNVCVPTITTQPPAAVMLDKVSNPSASTTLSVAANGGALTYQWYIGQPGTTTQPISGATSSSYTASPNADTTYWVRVTGTCGIAKDSSAATVTLCKAASITSHPPGTSVNPNTNVTLNVIATGTDLTYQWYVGTSGTTTSPLSGATGPSHVVSPSTTTDYWVRVTGRCGAVNSNTAKISIAPTITTQPAGGSVTKGSTRTLSVAATGTQLSYEWYLGAGTTTRVATTASYTTPPLNADAIYWARVWSGNAYRDSAQAVFTVCQPRTVNIGTNTSVSGAAVTLFVSGSASGETFTWYRGESGDTSAPAGYVGNITVYPLETTRYWVRTTQSSCTADSPAVTVLVCYPKITAQPQSAMINSGTTRTLTVAATGTPALSYQWYRGDTGVTTTPVGTGPSYTTPALTATTKYWVRVQTSASACGTTNSVNSETATVSVCNPPAIAFQPQSQIVNSQSSQTIIAVEATGDNLSYQWYEGSSGVTATPVGTNSSTLTITPVTTRSYWVRVTGTCGTADSVAALQSVMPQITSQPSPASTTVCRNSTVSYSVNANGSALTYRWYRLLQGSSVPEQIGTSPTVSVVATGPMEVWCQIASGNATAYSNHVQISVINGPDVWSISKTQPTGTYYKLTANVATADQPYVTYAWYAGAVGNTSGGMIVNDPSLYYFSSAPASFWVRVTRTSTGCSTDMGISVP
ncbi:MAG TPA: hypothetical protein VEK57_03795 [Thermoanaerobaculia bacterium]|nr:hypothetical protein [Thermoanaerobaculia bacterium]